MLDVLSRIARESQMLVDTGDELKYRLSVFVALFTGDDQLTFPSNHLLQLRTKSDCLNLNNYMHPILWNICCRNWFWRLNSREAYLGQIVEKGESLHVSTHIPTGWIFKRTTIGNSLTIPLKLCSKGGLHLIVIQT